MAKKGERKVSGSVALDSAEPTPEGKIAVLEEMQAAGLTDAAALAAAINSPLVKPPAPPPSAPVQLTAPNGDSVTVRVPLDITPETGFVDRTAAARAEHAAVVNEIARRAHIAGRCTTCGNPVALGAACVVDGTVAA